MDHIFTEPNLYKKGETYIDFDWDCIDLNYKIKNLSMNLKSNKIISDNASDQFYKENDNFNYYVIKLYKNIIN